MQAVDLNLASRPFKNDTLLWTGLGAAVALLAFATWWNADTYLRYRAMLGELETSEANMQRQWAELGHRSDTAIRKIDKFDLDEIQLKADKANEVIRWKAFSWTRLFNLLQEVQPYNVQMTSIHPVFRSSEREVRGDVSDVDQVPVSVEGIAKTLEDFLAFERELIRSPYFDQVEPDRHTLDEVSNEVVFRLRFLYDPRVATAQDQQLVAEAGAEPGSGTEEEPGEGAEGAEAAPPGAVASVPPAEPGLEPEQGALASDDLKKIERKGRKHARDGATVTATPPEAPPQTAEAVPTDGAAAAAPAQADETPARPPARRAAPTAASALPRIERPGDSESNDDSGDRP